MAWHHPQYNTQCFPQSCLLWLGTILGTTHNVSLSLASCGLAPSLVQITMFPSALPLVAWHHPRYNSQCFLQSCLLWLGTILGTNHNVSFSLASCGLAPSSVQITMFPSVLPLVAWHHPRYKSQCFLQSCLLWLGTIPAGSDLCFSTPHFALPAVGGHHINNNLTHHSHALYQVPLFSIHDRVVRLAVGFPSSDVWSPQQSRILTSCPGL